MRLFLLVRRFRFLLLLVGLAGLVRCCVADLGRVAGRSMQPALADGDLILTNKLAYGLRLPFTHTWLLEWSAPSRGEVIILSSPLDGRRLVKRVVAVPGDCLGADRVVPPGHFFVQGDAADSLDSRTFGCLPRERILGRVVGKE